MVKSITLERWHEAQIAERICHKFDRKQGESHYKNTYHNYFKYLEIKDSDAFIVEIGCADFPALQWVKFGKGLFIEPMPSDILKEIAKELGCDIIAEPVENIDIPECDEIWLLNVMQHVINPDLFIFKCKEAAKLIRFFEPIDWPIEIYHPHTFTFEWYKTHFPDAKLYDGKHPNFHEAKCAYGIWSQV
jgi:hypothetical protein